MFVDLGGIYLDDRVLSGPNAVIAADATATKNVADNVIVAGSPAKGIKKIE